MARSIYNILKCFLCIYIIILVHFHFYGWMMLKWLPAGVLAAIVCMHELHAVTLHVKMSQSTWFNPKEGCCRH